MLGASTGEDSKKSYIFTATLKPVLTTVNSIMGTKLMEKEISPRP